MEKTNIEESVKESCSTGSNDTLRMRIERKGIINIIESDRIIFRLLCPIKLGVNSMKILIIILIIKYHFLNISLFYQLTNALTGIY